MQPVSRHLPRALWTFILVCFVCLAAGCTSRATAQIVPLGTQRISTKGPLITEVSFDECYYWIDDGDRLCVAMRERKPNLFDRRLNQEFVLSLVLDDPPAGLAKDYRFHRRTARCRTDAAIFHTRSASTSGIATVWDYGRPALRGRFRFHAKVQTYDLLAGWRDDGSMLFTGEFAAVANREKGEVILAESEGPGMERSAVVERPVRKRPAQKNRPRSEPEAEKP